MKQKLQGYLKAFLLWRMRNISDRQFIIALSLVVGICSGIAAVILKNLVHFVAEWVSSFESADRLNFLLLIFPMIGILLTVFYLRTFVKDKIDHGVSRVLYAISRGGGILNGSKMYSSTISSTLTVGFGGSVGLEAPIVLTGSAIGSNIGQWMRTDKKSMILLIGCGATGAVAGIFKAPIAGIIFTLEVLMLDLTMASLVPLLISAVSATAISWFLLGNSIQFSAASISEFQLGNIPFYIILGVFAGLVSVYFAKMSRKMEGFWSKWKNPWVKAVVGGGIVSALIFIFPPLYGEGFTSLTEIMQGYGHSLANNTFLYEFRENAWLFLGFLLLILFFKVIAMATTNAAGGIGGVFAPSLFMGGTAGYLISHAFNTFTRFELPTGNFVLAGMAGIMAGVMHAPLTAIFLIAEITDGYRLFMPLTITATIAYLINAYFEPHSIYAKGLAEKGELVTHHKDKAAIGMLKLEDLIERNFVSLPVNGKLQDVVNAVSRSSRFIYPVLNENGELQGVVNFDRVKKMIFDKNLYATPIKNFMTTVDLTINLEEDMDNVVARFRNNDAYNIPVLQDGKYVGFLSRARLFSAYRKQMLAISED